MCRTDRRCPNCGGRTAAERRNNARIRKQRSVAGLALRAALANGATAAARTAEQQLRAIEGGDATADKILAELTREQRRPDAAVEAPAPATPATPAVAAELHGSEATSPETAPKELVQTKTGSPALIDAWLTDLQRQGYRVLSTSETQVGRNLRVTVRFTKPC